MAEKPLVESTARPQLHDAPAGIADAVEDAEGTRGAIWSVEEDGSCGTTSAADVTALSAESAVSGYEDPPAEWDSEEPSLQDNNASPFVATDAGEGSLDQIVAIGPTEEGEPYVTTTEPVPAVTALGAKPEVRLEKEPSARTDSVFPAYDELLASTWPGGSRESQSALPSQDEKPYPPHNPLFVTPNQALQDFDGAREESEGGEPSPEAIVALRGAPSPAKEPPAPEPTAIDEGDAVPDQASFPQQESENQFAVLVPERAAPSEASAADFQLTALDKAILRSRSLRELQSALKELSVTTDAFPEALGELLDWATWLEDKAASLEPLSDSDVADKVRLWHHGLDYYLAADPEKGYPLKEDEAKPAAVTKRESREKLHALLTKRQQEVRELLRRKGIERIESAPGSALMAGVLEMSPLGTEETPDESLHNKVARIEPGEGGYRSKGRVIVTGYAICYEYRGET